MTHNKKKSLDPSIKMHAQEICNNLYTGRATATSGQKLCILEKGKIPTLSTESLVAVEIKTEK